MVAESDASQTAAAIVEERTQIAPQWKLVWWRFLQHRLAVAATVVVLLFYLVALIPEFLAIHDPHEAERTRLFMPPQPVHFFDGLKPTWPYVYDFQVSRDPVTLALKFDPDESVRYPIGLFVQGFEYEFLGLFTTNIHLMGLPEFEGKKVKSFYPLGTDKLGRDMWSRLVYGTRISMSIGLVGVGLSIFLGVLLGGLSGYRGGITDLVIQRVIEFFRSIPTIPLWLALAAAVPPDWSDIQVYFGITIIISFIGWTTLAREVRGRFLAMREEDFVFAARLYGTSEVGVIFKHMVPSFISHIIATTTLAVPIIIIAETSLSFLGLGLRAPIISWGVLMHQAQNLTAVASAPWLLIPGLAVIIAVLGFNFMGDGLRDAADPYAVVGGE